MADLESLVEVSYLTLQTGKVVSEISDEELEELVMRGRLAREAEAEGARVGRTRKESGKKSSKKAESAVLLDLTDFGDDDGLDF